MIDRGLFATVALVFAIISILDRLLRRPSREGDSILGLASAPLMFGIAAGRLVAVAMEDPATLRRPLDLLLIRGGMEFWPGLLAAATAVCVASRRDGTRAEQRIAVLSPFALWAYGVYEVTCLLRDGCFGPPFSGGLRPGGIGEPQLPVGALVGVGAVLLGIVLWRWAGLLGPRRTIVVGILGLATLRATAGFVLPKVTTGLTRPHRESLAVLVLGLVCVGGALLAPAHWRRNRGELPRPARPA